MYTDEITYIHATHTDEITIMFVLQGNDDDDDEVVYLGDHIVI